MLHGAFLYHGVSWCWSQCCTVLFYTTEFLGVGHNVARCFFIPRSFLVLVTVLHGAFLYHGVSWCWSQCCTVLFYTMEFLGVFSRCHTVLFLPRFNTVLLCGSFGQRFTQFNILYRPILRTVKSFQLFISLSYQIFLQFCILYQFFYLLRCRSCIFWLKI